MMIYSLMTIFKYDKDGNLTCIVCDTIVRSEAVWTVHINSKNHRQNIANKVKKKEEPILPPPPPPEKFIKPSVSTLKRSAPPPPIPVSTKKIKSILKNAPAEPKYEKVPSDFFDTPEPMETDAPQPSKTEDIQSNENDEDEEEAPVNGDSLPEGFFDDPKLDAKVKVKFKKKFSVLI